MTDFQPPNRTAPPAPKGVLVTGTDTDAGKTLFSSALLHAVSTELKLSTTGFKPVASGLTENKDGSFSNLDVDFLSRGSSLVLDDSIMCPYQLRTACAPHIAAELDGVQIDKERILECANTVFFQADFTVVEGAGGFMVPLTLESQGDTAYGLDDLFVEISSKHQIGAIIVVGMRLGCINHARLTAYAIQQRGIPLLGWVANCLYSNGAFVQDNIACLEELLPCPRLVTLPHLEFPEGSRKRQIIEKAASHIPAAALMQRMAQGLATSS